MAVDLSGGHCQPDMRDPTGYSMGFVTFFCATSDDVDRPHLAAGEKHGIVVIVRVPRSEAKAFSDAHPAPQQRAPSGESLSL